MCQSSYENVGAAASSYYVTEDSFQSAEQNAFEHEEQARRARQDKELKLQEFQNKTKENAQKRLKMETMKKKQEQEKKKNAARENQIKAKEYAKKQREIIT